MFIEAEVWMVARTDKGNTVLVRPLNSDRAVPIFIGTLEAQNILLGMGEVEIPRPLTHDLLLACLRDLGANLLHVEIHSLEEGTYFANLVVEGPKGRLLIDSRPSDALALAVRAECPIFLNEALLAEASVDISTIQAEEDEPAGPAPRTLSDEEVAAERKEELEKELARAVAEENYEEAARLRDQLKRLF